MLDPIQVRLSPLSGHSHQHHHHLTGGQSKNNHQFEQQQHHHHHHHYYHHHNHNNHQRLRNLIYMIKVLIVTHLISSSSSSSLFTSLSVTAESCTSHHNSSPDTWIRAIEPQADVHLAVLLNVHQRGNGGIYDCGNITREGLLAHETLSWLIGLLNQDSGSINGQAIDDSFVPGLKLGAKVFDGCHRPDISVAQLAEIYPILKSGPKKPECPSDQHINKNNHNINKEKSSELTTLGVLDLTDISSDPQINEYTHRNFIPIVPLSLSTAIPPDTTGKILGQLIHDLEWTQVAIIHEADEHSVHIVKLLGQIAMISKLCLTAVERLPQVDRSSLSSSLSELRSFGLVYNTLTSQLEENMPILVIGRGESTKRFAEVLIENTEVSSRFQWLFSSLPPPEVIKSLTGPLGSRIFTLAPFPGTIAMLEDYWQELQKPLPPTVAPLNINYEEDANAENENSNDALPLPSPSSWFQEYLEHVKNCQTVDKCMNRLLPESPVDILWRTYNAYPLIHSVFTFAHALKDAWLHLCNGQRGLCPQLSQLSRREFVSHFLEPFEFSHNLSSRSPPEISGRKSGESRAGEIEGIRLALTKFVKKGPNSPIGFNQLIVYDSGSQVVKVIDPNFEFRSSPCPPSGCLKCVKIRQSRVEEENNESLLETVTQSSSSFSSSPSPSSPLSSTESGLKVADGHLNLNFIPDEDHHLEKLNEDGGLKSNCLTKCAKCWKQFKSAQLTRERPVLSSNFKHKWGMVSATLSGLGVVAVLICGLYFLMVFPVTVGTTVLGYFILFGLLILYLVNFAFLLPVSFPVCWLRPFGMATAYTVILSGMLIKVMNTWRLMAYGNRGEEDLQLTSVSDLLTLSGGLVFIQILITLTWLILFPPKPGFYSSANDQWQCSKPSSKLVDFLFQTESSASLLFTLILLIVTIFFCFLTWKSYEKNREPRYILICCLTMSLTWTLWSLFSSSISSSTADHSYFPKEITVIGVNLVNGTLIMVLMFMRKLYIYLRLTRLTNSFEIGGTGGGGVEYKTRLKPTRFPPSLYGTVHKTNPIIWENDHHLVYYGSGSGGGIETGSKRRTLRGATRKPFEADQVDDGTSSCGGSTTGSVQVQPQDLYPMEVFDGGSQFQAMSSLFNANSNPSLYLMDDNSTYIR